MFVAYLTLSLILLVTPARWTDPVRHIVLLPLSLFQQATLWAVRGVEAVGRKAVGGWSEASELERLRAEMKELEAQLQKERHLRLRAERTLEQYLTLPEPLRERSVAARLTGVSASPMRRLATFNKGTLAGVRRHAPVFWHGNVLGRVDSAGPGSCSVVLVGDRDCRIAVRCVRSRVSGVLEGLGGTLCKVKYVGRKDEVRVGDRFVTSGLDGVFPAGRFVGTCVESTDETGEIHRWVEVKPAFDLRFVETVSILLEDDPEEGEHADR